MRGLWRIFGWKHAQLSQKPIMFSSFLRTCSMCENEFHCWCYPKSGQLTSYRLIVTSHYLPWGFIYILSVVIAGFLNHQQYGCKMLQENGKHQLSSNASSWFVFPALIYFANASHKSMHLHLPSSGRSRLFLGLYRENKKQVKHHES